MKKEFLSFFLAAVLTMNAAFFSFDLSGNYFVSRAEDHLDEVYQPTESFDTIEETELPVNTEVPETEAPGDGADETEPPVTEMPESTAPPETPEPQVTDGATFNANALFQVSEPLDSVVKSIEASVCFPRDKVIESRGGIILGNYNEVNPCVNFEVFSLGNPRVYTSYSDGTVLDYVFNEINVYTGKWEHLTFVYNEGEGLLHCYVNGELKQSLEVDSSIIGMGFSFDRSFCIGGDLRSFNNMYFTGRMKSMAVYSTERSAEEIAESYRKFITEDFEPEIEDSLLAAYYFEDYLKDFQEGVDLADIVIEDISGQGHSAVYDSPWMKEKEPVKEYAYSFAVVGDTQIVSYHYPEKMDAIYDWIVENVEEKNIKLVMGLGDITDRNSAGEWSDAYRNLKKLDGHVPYTIVRGNHDSKEKFNNVFKYDDYKDSLGGSYDDNMLNTWRIITIGETKYLIMSLDYGPSDEVLRWADQVVMSHYDCNVIVTTHAYLFKDGTTLDIGDMCPPSVSGGYNNGDDIWEKFASKHGNIVLILSGHDPCDRLVTVKTKGVHGNEVTQMLVDPQGIDAMRGAAGMIAMLYFSEDGKQVEVEYYSTVRDLFFMEENQFKITLDTVEPYEHKKITGISLKTPPKIVEYEKGSELDVSGAEIYVSYDDGTGEIVKVFADMLNGGYNGNLIGKQKVFVKFAGFETFFEVSVNMSVPPDFTGISYDTENGIVKNVSAGITVASFLEGFEDKSFCRVFFNGTELSDNEKIRTGAEVRLMEGETVNDSVTVSVRGDVNGDGNVSVTDMLTVKSDILEKSEIEAGASMAAADVNGDGKITITDFLKIKAIILGKE